MSKICGNCFSTIESNQAQCPLCGFDSKRNYEKYPMALPCGTVLAGRFIIGRVLGQGGFGITYLAKDYKSNKKTAVKEYYPESFAGRHDSISVSPHSTDKQKLFDKGKQDFLKEAQILAEFRNCGNIVHIYYYFEENETAYFVMDYIDGINLGDYLSSKGGKISWQETLSLMLPVMKDLDSVHKAGIIHRDIKPDNLYITEQNKAILLDFGAARYSTGEKSLSLSVIVTPGYAPKEQYIRRSHQGPYTDIYALAATMYKMITGIKPQEAIERWDHDELITPYDLGINISKEDESVLLKAMSVQQDDRYQNIGAFIDCFPRIDFSKENTREDNKVTMYDEWEEEFGKTELNEAAEVKYYRKAADQGNAEAQNNLGDCYFYGKGVKQDFNEATKWYRKAAEQGHTNAKKHLSLCCNNGQGIEAEKLNKTNNDLESEFKNNQSTNCPICEGTQEDLEVRIGKRISEGLTKKELEEFDALINSQSDTTKWLNDHVPNLVTIVEEELSRFKNIALQNSKDLFADDQDQKVVQNNSDGSVIEGYKKNGVWNGPFTKTFKNGAMYKGTYANNKVDGELTYTDNNGNTLICEWHNGNWNGNGTYKRKNGVLTGKWVNGAIIGKVTYKYKNGCVYEGEIKNFLRHGTGKMTFPDKAVYDGEWAYDKYSGRGTYIRSDGFKYIGEWGIESEGYGIYVVLDSDFKKTWVYDGPYGVNHPTKFDEYCSCNANF